MKLFMLFIVNPLCKLIYDVHDSVTLLAARSQALAWERDCNKSFALNQKNEIEPEKEAKNFR